MLDQVLRALIDSENQAADDVLLEALRLGTLQERLVAFSAMLKRKSVRGLCGVIGMYDALPEVIQLQVMTQLGEFHHALREAGRSDDYELRIGAMKLIAMGKQGKLAYVLSENLHSSEQRLIAQAVESIVALAKWIATETRKLQSGQWDETRPRMEVYRDILSQREELEAAIARAMDGHRGEYAHDLARAALLLCDIPSSKTLDVLTIVRHNGQAVLLRKLQQPPASEYVDAFLVAAFTGPTRGQFGNAFAHIEEKPVLDALLRRTYLLKNVHLEVCMKQVQRGAWLDAGSLQNDLARRGLTDGGKIAEWIVSSGIHDAIQDERLMQLLEAAKDRPEVRLGIFRVASRRRGMMSMNVIRHMLRDPNETLARMALRNFMCRKPRDLEQTLLGLMNTAPESVRRIVSRAIGQSSFDSFWNRFDRLDDKTRKHAGRALFKALPGAVERLQRKLGHGPTEQRIKAIKMAQEAGVLDQVKESLVALTKHANPKVRSKAIGVLGHCETMPEVILDRVLTDEDPRVRANAIEVLEQNNRTQYIPLLTQRARSAESRERANAIKALHRMKVGTSIPQLIAMLQDPRSDHRISAMWAMKQMGVWKLIQEIGQLAKRDEDTRVRRYALNILKDVAELISRKKSA